MKRAVLLALTLACGAAQASEPFNTVGVGTNSCGKFLEVRSASPQTPEADLLRFMMISWAQGYISGMNAYRAVEHPKRAMVALPDPPSIEAYLDKHCRNNPLGNLKDGVFALFIELEIHNH
jgi:hypothetical protein